MAINEKRKLKIHVKPKGKKKRTSKRGGLVVSTFTSSYSSTVIVSNVALEITGFRPKKESDE